MQLYEHNANFESLHGWCNFSYQSLTLKHSPLVVHLLYNIMISSCHPAKFNECIKFIIGYSFLRVLQQVSVIIRRRRRFQFSTIFSKPYSYIPTKTIAVNFAFSAIAIIFIIIPRHWVELFFRDWKHHFCV